MAIKMVLAAGWFIPGEQLLLHQTYIKDTGTPAYMSIHGRKSDAYALFETTNWQYKSITEQLDDLAEHQSFACVILPYKGIDTDE